MQKDIVTSALHILFTKHAEFESIGNVKAFLFTIIKNKCLTHLSNKRNHTSELLDISSNDYIEAQIIRNEFLQQVYQEIEQLPPLRKKVFKLFYIEGLSVAQISKTLKIPCASVSNNKMRAIKQLKGILSLKKIIPLLLFTIANK